VATDRPKASYLDWFKELIANYKLIAMLIVALTGYSGVNLWQDVERYRAASDTVEEKPEQIPGANYSGFNPADFALKTHTHPISAGLAMKEHIARDHIKDHLDLHQ